MGGASGVEAEILLPKKDERRLWTGILERGLTVLYFVVLHLKEERDQFEPLATQIISSLRFPAELEGVLTNEDGLPLPPGYSPIQPQSILEDIADATQWRAYDGKSGIDGLQAFYATRGAQLRLDRGRICALPQPGRSGLCALQAG